MPSSSLDASAHQPSNGPVPDPPPSSSVAQPPQKQQRAMLPKSSTIVAKTNYVSPYRQNVPSRSVSTPLTKSGTSAGNTHSPNFKDIVSRFNNKQDEKIPNPSNRIPAVAAGPVGYKTKKSPAWKPAGGNGQAAPRSNSSGSNGRGKAGERSMSAQASHGGSNGEKAGGGGGNSGRAQQPKARKMSVDTGFANSRNLPPLDTSVNDRHLGVNNGHRRSRSALEIHSPSAASLADTEGEANSPLTTKPLRHRRSRSNVEIYNSPDDDFEMNPIFTRSTQKITPPRSPSSNNKSGIPLPRSRVASPSSPNPKRKGGGSKAEGLAPIAISSHGSRRSPQPISSPRLAAYISAPLPAKSPPLRSSRGHRLQTAGSTTSRQKFQNGQSSTPPPGYAKDGGIQRGRGVRGSGVGETRGREIKKKIPELGQVDFAARRARIQSAFNRTLKETNEGQGKVVSRGHSKRSVRGEIEEDTLRSAVSERIDEEDEGEEELVRSQIQFANDQAETELEFEAVQEVRVPEPTDPNLGSVDLILGAQEEEIFQEAPERLNVGEVYERPVSQASTMSRDSSESSFEDDIPLPIEGTSLNQLSRDNQPLNEEDTLSPRTRARPFSLIEPRRGERSIPLIVTPDSPPSLTQVSNFLRPESSWSGWSINSEYNNRDSTPVPDMPAHHLFNSVGVVVDPPPSDQRESTTSLNSAYIPIMLGREKGGLSPISPMISNASDTPIDDRATIADVFEHYDEPREDFLKSYANTELDFTDREMESQNEYEGETQDEYQGEETELEDGETTEAEHDHDETDADGTEGEYSHCDGEYDEQYDSTSCSEIPDSARPSVDDQSDGWTSASPSPEMDVHPARRLSMNSLLDSPTTPRQFHDMDLEEIDSPLPPTPPPKDSHFLPPVPPAKDPPRAVSPSPSAMSAPAIQPNYSGYTSHRMPTYGFPSYPLQLPEIQRDTVPLGLAIITQPDEPSDIPTAPPGNTRPSFDRWHTAPTMENQSESSRPSLDYQSSYMGSRQSLDQYSSHRPSLDQPYPRKSSDSPSSSFYSEIESRLSNLSAGQNGHQHSETPASSMAPTNRESSSIHSQEQILPQIPPEQKMMTKRRHLLKELVDTENSYFRDMTVAMEIYKGSANACAAITGDDIKVLFGNTDSIVQFSKSFLEALRLAVGSVYVMRRARSGVTSSAASIAGSVMSSDERNSGLEDFEHEEEKDRKTYVGEVFMDMFYNMEKVYGEYCKNHDNAVGRLAKLQDNRGVAVWLTECKTCAEDLTSAWNLESLLIKPVQRILKYPLLLTQLLECTPRSHPDYTQLDVAAKEMKFVANRINEMKKRKDMVEKIVGRGGKRQESDIGHGITKAFARRAEKLKQSVGLSEVVVDDTYNRLFEHYNMHFVQVQVIIRDIEIYNMDIQGHVDKFLEYTQTIQQYVDISNSQYPELESKWRKFDSAMRELATTYLTEHKLRVRKHAIEPLEMLLKMHESPQRIMTKRNKKAVDFARFRAIKERGDTPDKKTKDLADAYTALNETLIDELPKLFRLTKRLVDAVLTNFVELQGLWMNSWASKIKMTFPELATSESLEDIIVGFEGDIKYNEQSLNHLGICNGTLKAALMKPSSILSPAMTTLSLEAFEDPAAYRRPSTGSVTPEVRDMSPTARDRAMSLTTHSPTASSFFDKSERFFDSKSERRYSGGSTLSPLVAMAPGVLPVLPSLAQNTRNRSTSVAHTLPNRMPSTNSLNPQVQRSYSERQPPSATREFSRPLSKTYSLAETIFDGPETQTAYASSSSLIDPRVESRSPSRAPSPSAPSVFSSAMPMDDDREMRPDIPEPSGSPRTLSRTPSIAPSVASSMHSQRRTLTLSGNSTPIFVAASLYEFNIDKQRREGGFPYLTYVQGEIFDVVGTKGEIWLAKNQDDKNGELGWIWCKHFACL